MNSSQLIRHIDAFQTKIQDQGYLLSSLETFPSDYQLLFASAVMTSTEGLNNYDKRVYSNSLGNLRQKLQQLKSRQIFNSVDVIERACIAFAKDNGVPKIEGSSKLLLSHLSIFSAAYENYLNGRVAEGSSLQQLLSAGSQLFVSLLQVLAVLSDINSKLQGNPGNEVDSKDLERFSLLLESRVDFNRFAEKLFAINLIYLELCSLLKVSPLEHPIVIVKVESGSTWTELLAYPKIISLMVSLIERTADYFYRTFTREGKIAALPRKVEVVEEIIELRKKLRSLGIDTTKIDDELNKSTVILADQLNRLLVGEPKITLNDRIISISAAFEKNT